MSKKMGRPRKYDKVLCVETGIIYESCEEAAKDIGGFRNKVYLTAKGRQSHHHGFRFKFVKREE